MQLSFETARPASAIREETRPGGPAPAGEASRATDAELTLPAPPGLSYLGYQRAGIAYALTHPTCLIADEMGLGKTVQALGLINADPSIGSALIVCPASLKVNWSREARRWLVRPMGVGIAGEAFPARTPVVIVNYEQLRKFRGAIRARTWDLAVFDEAHYCKNPQAQRTIEVFGQRAWTNPATGKRREHVAPIPARRRLFLTGTPILNRPVELWPLLKAMGWEWLPFVTRYCEAVQRRAGKKLVWDTSGPKDPTKPETRARLDELQRRLREQFMVRRLKADVLTELPPKRRQIIEVSAGGAARQVQAELALLRQLAPEASADEYLDAVSRLGQGQFGAFGELSRIRHEIALAKIPAVVEHVTECLESSAKLVLFNHHKDALYATREALSQAGIKSVALTGDMTGPAGMAARQRAVDDFQGDPSVRVFCGTIDAAGVGLTLTAASHVVFGELAWVPGKMSQAEDRCHRLGQRDSVLVQHLVFEGSLDALIAQTLVRKQSIIEAALDAH